MSSHLAIFYNNCKLRGLHCFQKWKPLNLIPYAFQTSGRYLSKENGKLNVNIPYTKCKKKITTNPQVACTWYFLDKKRNIYSKLTLVTLKKRKSQGRNILETALQTQLCSSKRSCAWNERLLDNLWTQGDNTSDKSDVMTRSTSQMLATWVNMGFGFGADQL